MANNTTQLTIRLLGAPEAGKVFAEHDARAELGFTSLWLAGSL